MSFYHTATGTTYDHLPEGANAADYQDIGERPSDWHYWDDAQTLWVEVVRAAPLDQFKTNAIAKTYTDVDALYATAVGNRAEEYRQAEAAALAYQAAGYTGAVSEYVSAWAAANPPMTDAQSADAIIARAALLRASMVAIRTQRFVSQAALRAAVTQAEADTAMATWDAFVVSTKAALA